jgi:hypothetical protein
MGNNSSGLLIDAHPEVRGGRRGVPHVLPQKASKNLVMKRQYDPKI